jgi:hypothetical protein
MHLIHNNHTLIRRCHHCAPQMGDTGNAAGAAAGSESTATGSVGLKRQGDPMDLTEQVPTPTKVPRVEHGEGGAAQ